MSDGYFQIPNAFIDDGHLARLSPTALRVVLVLARGQGGNGAVWWGARSIAKVLGLADVAAVRRAFRELRDVGMLTVVDAGGGSSSAKRHVTLTPVAESTRGQNQPTGNNDTGPVAESAQAPRAKSAMAPVAESAYRRRTEKKNIEKEQKEEQVDFPECLQTDAFRQAWAEWVMHRQQIRKKLTPLATKKQLAMLAELGEPQAIREIERAIAGGWQGFYPEKNGSTKNGNGKQFTSSSEFAEPDLAIPTL